MYLSDVPRSKLKYAIDKFSTSLCSDQAQTEAALKDLCGGYKQEIELILAAQKEGIPLEFCDISSSCSMDYNIDEMVSRLKKRKDISDYFARWAVETWAFALGFTCKPHESIKATADIEQIVSESSEKNVFIFPWFRMIVVVILLFGAWFGFQYYNKLKSGIVSSPATPEKKIIDIINSEKYK